MVWPFFQSKKIGLALGGGVARGLAHIGVLKVLDSYQIPVDYVVGTSSGSIVGALYAYGMEVTLIEQIALHVSWGEVFKLAWFRPGFISSEAIENFVAKYIGEIKFSELKIPFATVATDIRTGELLLLKAGRVARAVAASSAFPGFFAPQEIEGRFLVDGGLASNVPVDSVRSLGANYVIASDVIPGKPVIYLPKDPLQSFGRSLDLVLKKTSTEEAKRAEALIELEMEEDIWQLDLGKAKKLITIGEVAAHREINQIRRSLGLRS